LQAQHFAGSKAAFLERIVGGAHTAAYVATYIGSYIPGVGGFASGMANGLLGRPDSLAGNDAWMMLERAGDFVGKAQLLRMGSRIASSMTRAGTSYASRFGYRAVSKASLSKAGPTLGALSEAGLAAAYTRGTYREVRKVTRGLKGEVEAHHLAEKRHAAELGVNPDDMPAVALPKIEHQAMTARFRNRMQFGKKYKKDEIKAACEEIYKDHPEYWNDIKSLFD